MFAARIIKKQTGFSLIELMIVVSIVATLSIIAIPNFAKLQARAKASESKAQLAALFSAEKAFKAEYGSYHTDAANIGYRPTGVLRYVIGFNTPSLHTVNEYDGPALDATKFSTGILGVCAVSGCTNIAMTPAGAALTVVSLATTASVNTFNAAAEGFIGGSNIDIWSINESKIVVNDSPGGY